MPRYNKDELVNMGKSVWSEISGTNIPLYLHVRSQRKTEPKLGKKMFKTSSQESMNTPPHLCFRPICITHHMCETGGANWTRQLFKHLKKHELTSDAQYGYGKQHSTEMTLDVITDAALHAQGLKFSFWSCLIFKQS